MVTEGSHPGPVYLDAVRAMVTSAELDPAFRAVTLLLPSEDDIAQALFDLGEVPEPLQIYQLRRELTDRSSRPISPTCWARFSTRWRRRAPTRRTPNAAGRRALRLAILSLLSRIDEGTRARDLFRAADNMTEQFGALSTLMEINEGRNELQSFYNRWSRRQERRRQMVRPAGEARPARHGGRHGRDPDPPSRLRHGATPTGSARCWARSPPTPPASTTHRARLQLLADWLVKLDPINPQTTARMLRAFETWRRYNPDRQAQMTAALKRVLAAENLSQDTFEMVTQILSY